MTASGKSQALVRLNVNEVLPVQNSDPHRRQVRRVNRIASNPRAWSDNIALQTDGRVTTILWLVGDIWRITCYGARRPDSRSWILFCLSGFDVADFHVEVEGLAGQRMIKSTTDGFVLDLVNAHGDGLSLRALGHQHDPTFRASAGIFSSGISWEACGFVSP
jgi:hypothetical protein